MTAAVALATFLLGPPPLLGGHEEPVHVWQQLRTKSPDASFKGLDGTPQRLADHRGKVVVLDFWTTWCQPCLDELADLTRFHEWAKARTDVVFFAVNDDSDARVVPHFVAARKLAFPVLLMGRSNPLKITGYPTKILIDPDGLVRLRRWGGPVPAAELEEKALSLLGRGAERD